MFTETSKAERIEFDFMPFSLRIKIKKLKRRIFDPSLLLFFHCCFVSFINHDATFEGLKKWTAAISLMCEGLVWCNIKLMNVKPAIYLFFCLLQQTYNSFNNGRLAEHLQNFTLRFFYCYNNNKSPINDFLVSNCTFISISLILLSLVQFPTPFISVNFLLFNHTMR